MTRLLRFAVAALFAALAVAACSSNSGSTSTPPASPSASGGGGGGGTAAATITIKNFQFGSPVTVKPGDTVKVTNADSPTHNVTADDGSFKVPDLSSGQSSTFTAPSKAGTYKFSCTLHANMTGIGTLIVQG
jgi:plastocyanin